MRAMAKSSFMADSPPDSQRYNPVAKFEENQEELFDIGGPDSHLKGYIPKKSDIPKDLEKRFRTVLKEGRLLSASAKTKEGSNKTGIEQLHNKGKYAVKIIGDFRLVSTGMFFKKRSDESFDKVIRLSQVKRHKRL